MSGWESIQPYYRIDNEYNKNKNMITMIIIIIREVLEVFAAQRRRCAVPLCRKSTGRPMIIHNNNNNNTNRAAMVLVLEVQGGGAALGYYLS